MFLETYTAKQKRGTGWIISLCLHISGAALLATLGTSMLTPPAERNVTKLSLLSPPPDTVRPAPLPKQNLRTFKVPKLPKPIETARPLNLPELPVLQITAELPAPRPLATIPAPQAAAPPAQPLPTQSAPPQIKLGMLDAPQIASAPPTRPAPVVQNAGFSQVAMNEPNRRAASPIQPAGFDSGPIASVQNEPKRVASPGGFGDAVLTNPQQAAPRMPAVQSIDSNPVEITFKPRPAYTEEARRRQIEGEVVLQAIFAASGEVRVLRVVRGLGYGLDESAMAATHAIRFRPAKQNGQFVDTTATLRMSFALAY